MLDPVEFGKSMAAIVREAQAPLLKRIEVLEARQPDRGKDGENGKDGASVTVADVAPLIAEQVKAAVAEIPKPKDGINGLDGKNADPGKDGTSVTIEDVAPLIAEQVKLAIAAIPIPQNGVDGRDADPINIKDVVAEILRSDELSALSDLHAAEAVAKHFEANPIIPAKDGDPGKPGANGENASDEQIAKAVSAHLKANPPADGQNGADGIGLAGAMIDREGCLIVTTTRGDPIKLGIVVGKDGARGNDGADLSDVSFDYDGHRTITIKAKGGEVAKTYKLGVPLDRGYWRDGMDCEKGDIVTQLGNAWLALRDTKAKPCIENKDDWRLFARKGKDGTDGRPGRDLGPAPPVKLSGA